MQNALSTFALVTFLAALIGLVRPYKGLTRTMFTLVLAGSLAIIMANPTDGSTSDIGLIDVALMTLLGVAIWGMINPHHGIRRSGFFSLLILTILGIAVVQSFREPSPGQANAAQPPQAEVADKPGTAANDKILAKAKSALANSSPYDRKYDADLLAKVGPDIFNDLGKLERGAILATAESDKCDKVTIFSIAHSASSKNAPTWAVDCANENRYMVSADQARQALAREAAHTLSASKLGESCTRATHEMCAASPAQRAANETVIVSLCDIAAKSALVTKPSFEWGWDYRIAKGDVLRVTRNFTAENAFGARIKHNRYICEVNAATKEITKFVVQTPFGEQKLL